MASLYLRIVLEISAAQITVNSHIAITFGVIVNLFRGSHVFKSIRKYVWMVDAPQQWPELCYRNESCQIENLSLWIPVESKSRTRIVKKVLKDKLRNSENQWTVFRYEPLLSKNVVNG